MVTPPKPGQGTSLPAARHASTTAAAKVKNGAILYLKGRTMPAPLANPFSQDKFLER